MLLHTRKGVTEAVGFSRSGTGQQLVGQLINGDFDDSAEEMVLAATAPILHQVEGDGVSIFGGFSAIEGDRQRTLFRALCTGFGDLLPQDAQGTIVREVRDRGKVLAVGESGRYSDTRTGGDLHTDGVGAPQPTPDFFALLCVRPATEGGALLIVDGRELVKHLSPDATNILRESFHFDRRGEERDGEEATVARPILQEDGKGRVHVNYLRHYIECGHARSGLPDLTQDQIAAFDALDALLEDPELVQTDRLDEGEVAIIDNRRMLHGRTAFVDRGHADSHRLLLRTWIKKQH